MREILASRRALGDASDAPPRRYGAPEVVSLTELPSQPAVWLRFDETDRAARDAILDASGLSLVHGDRAVEHDGRTALWLGPGDWLVRAGVNIFQTLDRAGERAFVWTIDVSDMWFGVCVAGPRTLEVLAKGCALDLDRSSFPSGATAVTQFARLRALIHCRRAGERYDLHVDRSYAGYLWAWLVDATAEFIVSKEKA